ncbi:MAG: hypothetical protein QOC94_3016 [Actinoplanes sp.]|jgi:hypothetical protein|nr:hypothetical protein [Actinoplanes sp.]
MDLDRIIGAHVGSLSRDGPYRDPRDAERDSVRQALALLLAAQPDQDRGAELLGGIGFRATRGVDAGDGRQFVLYLAGGDTGWGGLLIDPAAPVRSVVEVPHPAYDRNTEKLGLSLYRKLPGSMLLIAGAHRQAAGGKADVAHNDQSMFQLIGEEVAARKLPQLQLHGFAERSLPGTDTVVSTGSGPHSELATRVARELQARRLRICRAWVKHCVGLEGTTNVQSYAAARYDAEFVHLELGWLLRRDQPARNLVRDAVVAAWID